MLTISELAKLHANIARNLQLARGAYRLNRPLTIQRRTDRRLADLEAESPALRLLLRNDREKARMLAEVTTEIEQPLRLAAGVVRHRTREARAQFQEVKKTIARTRRDTALSFPSALDGVSADGMIQLALLRVQLAPALAQASPATLGAAYAEALRRQDARGYVEAETIEALAESSSLSSSEADLPAAKALREHIEGVRDLRLPPSLPDFDQLEAQLNTLDARAEALKIQYVVPERSPQAAQIFAELEKEILEAGAASDADDQKRLLTDEAAAS